MRRLDSNLESKQILLRLDRKIYNKIRLLSNKEDKSITLKINELLESSLNNNRTINIKNNGQYIEHIDNLVLGDEE